MDLPVITIPVEIPEAVLNVIPALIHPAIVHFAIVLPLIILLLELINLIMKRKSLTVSIYLLFLLVMVVFAAAYVTGGIDGKEAYPLLNGDGKFELKEHKLLGTYLVYLTLLPVVFKLFSVLIKSAWFKIIYMLVLAGFVALTLFQGKEGGELVYKHGANVQMVSDVETKAEDLALELEELQEEMDELEAVSEKAEGLELKVKEQQEQIKTLESASVEAEGLELKIKELQEQINTLETAPVTVEMPVEPEVMHDAEPVEEMVEEAVAEHVVEEVVEEHTEDMEEQVPAAVAESVSVLEAETVEQHAPAHH